MKYKIANCLNKDAPPDSSGWRVSRRSFLKYSGAIIAGYSLGSQFGHADTTDVRSQTRFGILTDVHYADTPARGTRHYRESLAKMRDCVDLMNEQNVDFLIELGDFKDQNSSPDEKSSSQYLRTIESIFRQFNGYRYHVLGNHDVDSISKLQFLNVVENSGIEDHFQYYSFDLSGLHFIVLDANYRSDGFDYNHGNFDWTDANIPPFQLEWLEHDLSSTSYPVIVFVHQCLDGDDDHCVRNASQVRKILQESHKVLAVFQGHKHIGHHSYIENIHYYTLKSMVDGRGKENNSFAIVDVHSNNNILVAGYYKAVGQKMQAA